jgi:hypothetical protein
MLSTLLSGLGFGGPGETEKGFNAIKTTIGHPLPVTEYEYLYKTSNFTLNVTEALDAPDAEAFFIMPELKMYWNGMPEYMPVELRLYGSLLNVVLSRDQARSIYNNVSKRMEEIMGDKVLRSYKEWSEPLNPVYALTALYAVVSFHSWRSVIDTEEDPLHIIADIVFDTVKKNVYRMKYTYSDLISKFYMDKYADYPTSSDDADADADDVPVPVVEFSWLRTRYDLIRATINENEPKRRVRYGRILAHFPAKDDPSKIKTQEEYLAFVRRIDEDITRNPSIEEPEPKIVMQPHDIIDWKRVLLANLRALRDADTDFFTREDYARILAAFPAEDDPIRFRTTYQGYSDWMGRVLEEEDSNSFLAMLQSERENILLEQRFSQLQNNPHLVDFSEYMLQKFDEAVANNTIQSRQDYLTFRKEMGLEFKERVSSGVYARASIPTADYQRFQKRMVESIIAQRAPPIPLLKEITDELRAQTTNWGRAFITRILQSYNTENPTTYQKQESFRKRMKEALAEKKKAEEFYNEIREQIKNYGRSVRGGVPTPWTNEEINKILRIYDTRETPDTIRTKKDGDRFIVRVLYGLPGVIVYDNYYTYQISSSLPRTRIELGDENAMYPRPDDDDDDDEIPPMYEFPPEYLRR